MDGKELFDWIIETLNEDLYFGSLTKVFGGWSIHLDDGSRLLKMFYSGKNVTFVTFSLVSPTLFSNRRSYLDFALLKLLTGKMGLGAGSVWPKKAHYFWSNVTPASVGFKEIVDDWWEREEMQE